MPPRARQRQGDHGRRRAAGHGRQVAEIDGQRLVPYTARIDAGDVEIHSVHEHVDGYHHAFAARHVQHSRIVAGAQLQQRMGRQALRR